MLDETYEIRWTCSLIFWWKVLPTLLQQGGGAVQINNHLFSLSILLLLFVCFVCFFFKLNIRKKKTKLKKKNKKKEFGGRLLWWRAPTTLTSIVHSIAKWCELNTATAAQRIIFFFFLVYTLAIVVTIERENPTLCLSELCTGNERMTWRTMWYRLVCVLGGLGWGDQYGRRTTLSLSLLIDAVVLKVLHSTTTTTTRVVQLLSLLGCSRQHRPCIIRFFVCHKLLTWLIFFLRHHNNNHLFFCWMCGWQVRLLYVTPTSFWVVFFFFF